VASPRENSQVGTYPGGKILSGEWGKHHRLKEAGGHFKKKSTENLREERNFTTGGIKK